MLGTACLIVFCILGARTARKNGRSPAGAVWTTIGLGVGAGLLGLIFSLMVLKDDMNDILYLLLFSLPSSLLTAGGSLGAFFIVRAKKAVQTPQPAAVPFTPVQPEPVRADSGFVFCTNCGEKLSMKDKFCTNCGTPVRPVTPAVNPETAVQNEAAACSSIPAEAESAPLEEPPAAPAPKKRKGLLIALISVGAGLLAGALIVGGLMFYKQYSLKKRYQEAMDAYNSGSYKNAATAFADLGDVWDSAAMAEQAGRMASYTDAVKLAQGDTYEELNLAAELFESLGDFEDAPACAVKCRTEIAYLDAMTLYAMNEFSQAGEAFAALGDYRDSKDLYEECEQYMAYEEAGLLMYEGNYAAAKSAFEALGSFSDAAERAAECGDILDFDRANALVEAGSYEEALPILETLVSRNVEGAGELREECFRWVTYHEAESMYDAGRYYEARKRFLEVTGFKDADQRAEACVQQNPKAGELYRNSRYSKKTCAFKVLNETSRNAVVKMYLDGELVTLFYIPANSNTTVKVPAGTYTINRGYGEQWYGNEDLFGDEGSYYKLNIQGQTEFTFRSGYNYTLGSGSDGTAVGSQTTSRDDC